MKSVGETSPVVTGIHSFTFWLQKVIITLLWESVCYLLLLRLFGTLMCMGLKLQMLCYQSPDSLLYFDE